MFIRIITNITSRFELFFEKQQTLDEGSHVSERYGLCCCCTPDDSSLPPRRCLVFSGNLFYFHIAPLSDRRSRAVQTKCRIKYMKIWRLKQLNVGATGCARSRMIDRCNRSEQLWGPFGFRRWSCQLWAEPVHVMLSWPVWNQKFLEVDLESLLIYLVRLNSGEPVWNECFINHLDLHENNLAKLHKLLEHIHWIRSILTRFYIVIINTQQFLGW